MDWPKPKDEPYPWPPSDTASELLDRRWRLASATADGFKLQASEITRVIFDHLDGDATVQKRVTEIRWLSAREVLAEASRSSGSRSGAVYRYVLQKRAEGWRIVARYLLVVS